VSSALPCGSSITKKKQLNTKIISNCSGGDNGNGNDNTNHNDNNLSQVSCPSFLIF
jgi:hypothetical protein